MFKEYEVESFYWNIINVPLLIILATIGLGFILCLSVIFWILEEILELIVRIVQK